jgi:hypothetical protein
MKATCSSETSIDFQRCRSGHGGFSRCVWRMRGSATEWDRVGQSGDSFALQLPGAPWGTSEWAVAGTRICSTNTDIRFANESQRIQVKKKNSVALSPQATIPTERPPLVDEI